MIWYVHNISMNDHYKFWSIHIHTQNIIKYYIWRTFSGIRKKIAHREREGLNGIRFESLFGVRPRSLAQIAGITYARRSPRFALTPELYFPSIFVGIIIMIMLTTLDSKLYLLAVQNIFPLTGKIHARRYSSLSFSFNAWVTSARCLKTIHFPKATSWRKIEQDAFLLVSKSLFLDVVHESLYIENALDIENLTINVNSLQSVSGAGFMTCSIFVAHICWYQTHLADLWLFSKLTLLAKYKRGAT